MSSLECKLFYLEKNNSHIKLAIKACLFVFHPNFLFVFQSWLRTSSWRNGENEAGQPLLGKLPMLAVFPGPCVMQTGLTWPTGTACKAGVLGGETGMVLFFSFSLSLGSFLWLWLFWLACPGHSVSLSSFLSPPLKNCLSSLFILGWFLFLLKDLCNIFWGET